MLESKLFEIQFAGCEQGEHYWQRFKDSFERAAPVIIEQDWQSHRHHDAAVPTNGLHKAITEWVIEDFRKSAVTTATHIDGIRMDLIRPSVQTTIADLLTMRSWYCGDEVCERLQFHVYRNPARHAWTSNMLRDLLERPQCQVSSRKTYLLTNKLGAIRFRNTLLSHLSKHGWNLHCQLDLAIPLIFKIFLRATRIFP